MEEDDSLYQALPSPEYIRLLRLEAAPPDQEYLSYVMETFSLSDPNLPTYRALSYTWGSPVMEDEDDGEDEDDATAALTKVAQQVSLEESEEPMVFCNGYPMVVTSNLQDGLLRLANYDDIGHLWCDALCINQADGAEKGVCVPVIGAIFASAATVIVWLGNDTKYLDDFEWLHDAESMIEEAWLAFKEKPWDCHRILREGGTGSGEDEDTMVRRWASYTYSYNRLRFFSRAWIVQETALARDIWVHCGSKELSWDVMAALSRLMQYTGSPISFRVVDDEGIAYTLPSAPPGDRMSRIENLRDQCASGNPENGAPDDVLEFHASRLDGSATPAQCVLSYFKYLVSLVRLFDATDPHDKIFSVLGMVKRYLPLGVTMPIEVNYSMSVEELYTKTAFKLIQKIPLLSVLSMVEDKSMRQMSSLPSWVPDFSQTTPLTEMVHVLAARGLDCKRYLSGNNRPRRLKGNTLYLHGAFIDRIMETTPPEDSVYTSFDFKHPTRLIWLKSMLKLIAKQVERPYFTSEDYMDVFWKTRMAYIEKRDTDENSGQYAHWEPDQLADSFRCWLLSLLTMPFDPMGQSSAHSYIEAGASLMECVEKIVCHTQTGSDKWFRLQYDIPRYQKAQWVRLMHREGGVVRLGNWPDDPVEQAKRMEDFERRSEERKLIREHLKGKGKEPERVETDESKNLTLAKAIEEGDDFTISKALQEEEDSTFVALENLPTADVAEGEWNELVLGKDEYSNFVMSDRLMFVSKKGFVGLCPESACEGDQVWYIEDAAVLFVLRPRGERLGQQANADIVEVGSERFELVGEAFVHGLMDGQLLAEPNKFRGKVKPVAIV